MEGYVKINRKLLEWGYFSDGNVLKVFLFLLLRANHKDNVVFGSKVLRGQHVTSIRKISVNTDLSIKQVRLALNKLKKDHTIITRGTNKNTLVTIVKYDDYQKEDIKKGEQKANKGQSKDKQRATNNNDNNDNNEKNIDIEDFKIQYVGGRVYNAVKKNFKLNDQQIEELFQEFYIRQVTEGNISNSLLRYQRHFKYWLAKKINYKQTNKRRLAF